MLGSDLKDLIFAYKDIVADRDAFMELLSLDERILNELRIGRPSGNFFDEDKATLLYEITKYDLPADVIAGCIKAVRNCNDIEKARRLVGMLDQFYSIAKNDTAELFECALKYKGISEDFDDLEHYVTTLYNADQEDLGSLTFFRIQNKGFVREMMSLKAAISEYGDDDITALESLVQEIERRCLEIISNKGDVTPIIGFIKAVHEYIELITFGADETKENVKKQIYETLKEILNSSRNIKDVAGYFEFINLFDFDELCTEMEDLVVDVRIAALDDEFGKKITLIQKICNNIDMYLDQICDFDFIRRLMGLSINQLKSVERFSASFCSDSEYAYDNLFFFSDPKIISEYSRLSSMLRKGEGGITTLDDLLDGQGSLESDIYDAVEEYDEEAIEEYLSKVPDNLDVSPAILRFIRKDQ